MADKKQKKDLANVGSQNTQQEDAAMKTLALFFAEELFPLVNIKGKVKRVAPTEIVHLELKKMVPKVLFLTSGIIRAVF